MAGFAAVLLVVSSLAGISGSTLSTAKQSTLSTLSMASDNAPSLFQADSGQKTKKNKGFKMSLFLFRNN
jgi:hypothetical protein